ncbi:hypothetical protein KJ866_04735 [Patescibacteria group bacterium]|nr:hypothetical protein [Patescibacteria group bacterium]MBU2220122.1 hypothetical protein [Patescibacteria group bacterium]MBU2264938.1 hypothetical protein [Patescibacteria group bacterium]
MVKKQVKKQNQTVGLKLLEKLLDQQTKTILSAVDFKLEKSKEEIKEEFKTEIEKLANTLDKFLKRLTDFNDEFKIVKARLAKVEKILQERLGVAID